MITSKKRRPSSSTGKEEGLEHNQEKKRFSSKKRVWSTSR
jgi:hypothetical protein